MCELPTKPASVTGQQHELDRSEVIMVRFCDFVASQSGRMSAILVLCYNILLTNHVNYRGHLANVSENRW